MNLGSFLFLMEQINPTGVKFVPQGFFMAAVDHLSWSMLADSVAIIGSLDVVFGEIDHEHGRLYIE